MTCTICNQMPCVCPVEKFPAKTEQNYNYYNIFGSSYYYKFIERNPEFNIKEFEEYVISNNRGDRDSGELGDIAKFEILQLASEWVERRRRFPNVYGEVKE